MVGVSLLGYLPCAEACYVHGDTWSLNAVMWAKFKFCVCLRVRLGGLHRAGFGVDTHSCPPAFQSCFVLPRL